jgi:hypothetical protein
LLVSVFAKNELHTRAPIECARCSARAVLEPLG